MTKLKFLLALHEKLSGLPQEDVEERLSFYTEMIEDRMEEGLSEEEAVAAVGSVEEIAAQIRADISPAAPSTKAPKSKKQLGAWAIVLLAVGSPVWLALLIAAFAVLFSLYVSLWAVIIALWAVFGSLAGCVIGGILGGIVLLLSGHSLSGVALIGAGIVCAGLSILVFMGCKAATIGTVKLTKSMGLWIKKCFTGKEAA